MAREAVDHVKNTIEDLEDPDKRDQYINVDHNSLLNTISIASFNLGAEHEHLNQLHEALDAYRMALEYSKRSNIETLQKIISQAIKKVQSRLAEIDGSLTRRSVMRDAKAAGRFFNDSEHIKEIDRK